MSNNWVKDIADMQDKFGTREWVKNNPEKLKDFMAFRLDFIEEEFMETVKAFVENDPEEIVDGLIDICVVAIGTLDAFGVNANEAWNRVLEANMAKKVGIKKERPNPLGLPDLEKPNGWKAPSHEGNHGILNNIQ
jgi:hypothetical protein